MPVTRLVAPGPGGGHADAHLARGAGVAVGGVGRRLLVAHEDVAQRDSRAGRRRRGNGAPRDSRRVYSTPSCSRRLADHLRAVEHPPLSLPWCGSAGALALATIVTLSPRWLASGRTNVPSPRAKTAPVLAEVTSGRSGAGSPSSARGWNAGKAASAAATSAGVHLKVEVLADMSMADDVAILHGGDRARRRAASGETWPMAAPREAPEKRPSVIRATCRPGPCRRGWRWAPASRACPGRPSGPRSG